MRTKLRYVIKLFWGITVHIDVGWASIVIADGWSSLGHLLLRYRWIIMCILSLDKHINDVRLASTVLLYFTCLFYEKQSYIKLSAKKLSWLSDTWLSLLVLMLIICIVYLNNCFGLSTFRFGDVSTFRFVENLVCRRVGLSPFWFADVSVNQRFGLPTYWLVILRMIQFMDILCSVELFCCCLIIRFVHILKEGRFDNNTNVTLREN